MSYNEELQSNNEELVNILAMVNALPDAGGGGGSSNGLSVLVEENFTLAADLTSDQPTTIFQSEKIANQNWYCAIVKKLNPKLESGANEGLAAYRLNGFNTNMIRWAGSIYTSTHYNTAIRINDDGTVQLEQPGATLPWLAGDYELVIVG